MEPGSDHYKSPQDRTRESDDMQLSWPNHEVMQDSKYRGDD